MVVAGTLFIWAIKFFIRPYLHPAGVPGFLCGVAPNGIGSFLVPFAAYWLYTHPRFFNGRLLRFTFFSDVRLVCLFGFGLGVVNEYLQLVPVFGRTFDVFDILSSAVGLLLSCALFTTMQRRYAVL
jgi:glycopeptide antibiotics resistance protein